MLIGTLVQIVERRSRIPRLATIKYSLVVISVYLPIDAPNPVAPNAPFPVGSNGLIISLITPPNDKHPDPPFFFFDFDDNFRFLVCIPSFFIVSGRFTCKTIKKNAFQNLHVQMTHIILRRYKTHRICSRKHCNYT